MQAILETFIKWRLRTYGVKNVPLVRVSYLVVRWVCLQEGASIDGVLPRLPLSFPLWSLRSGFDYGPSCVLILILLISTAFWHVLSQR